jgi:hypothetical protein
LSEVKDWPWRNVLRRSLATSATIESWATIEFDIGELKACVVFYNLLFDADTVAEALQRLSRAPADIIIALEAPLEAKIYTTNVKHFSPILKMLDKELYEEKNNS